MKSRFAVVIAALMSLLPAAAHADELEQWGLDRIRAPEAWEITKGAGALVAVLDTGVARQHPDLAANIAGPGRDFVDGDDDADDPHGHGTYVTGIVAAALDGAGIVGAAPEARVLPVRVCGDRCRGDDVREGLIYAADAGARVVNMSFGSAELAGGSGEDAALAYATAKGVLVVAAAGNSPAQARCSHPALNPLVLCVGASGEDDGRAATSTAGIRLDLVAPGTGIVSTLPGGYGTATGTSAAAAFVSGVTALLASMGASAPLAAQIIRATARDVGTPGYDLETGWGVLDARAAAELCAEIC